MFRRRGTPLGLLAAPVVSCWLFAQEPEFRSPPPPPMAETIVAPRPAVAGSGLEFDPQSPDRLVIRRVVPGSPAAAAGLMAGDEVIRVNDQVFESADALNTYLAAVTDTARLVVLRSGSEQSLVYLADHRGPSEVESADSEMLLPVPRYGQSAGIGIRIAGSRPVQVVGVYGGSPADRAGILPGDELIAVDGIRYETVREVSAAIAQHAPGEELPLTLRRGGVEQQMLVTPEAWSAAFDEAPRVLPGWETHARRHRCYRYDDGLAWDDDRWNEPPLLNDGTAELAALRAEVRALRQELAETNARLDALQLEGKAP